MILLAPLWAWLLMLLLGAIHAQPGAEVIPAFSYLVSLLFLLVAWGLQIATLGTNTNN